MKAKKEIERALDGAIREVYDLAKQLGVGVISIHASTVYERADAAAYTCDGGGLIELVKIDFEEEE